VKPEKRRLKNLGKDCSEHRPKACLIIQQSEMVGEKVKGVLRANETF
jgi:hypothetical protein